MKSMASCVLARMSLSWSTLKHPLCGHPGILWPCWSLLIGTVSNFAWGAMLRPANSLFPVCCCARPIPRWYFAAICTCSQVGIANIFQLKQLKHCPWSWFASWSIRSHTASIKDCLVYLVGTPWCHIVSYRVISSQSCVFSPCFLARWLRMPWKSLECRQFHGHGVARACSVGNSAASRAEEGKVRTGLSVSTQGT